MLWLWKGLGINLKLGFGNLSMYLYSKLGSRELSFRHIHKYVVYAGFQEDKPVTCFT